MNHTFKIGDIVFWNNGDVVGQITSLKPAFLNGNSIAVVTLLKGKDGRDEYNINTCYLNLVTKDWINGAEILWIEQARSFAASLRNKI